MSNRDSVKEKVVDASKTLFNLSADKHYAIEHYANSKSNMMNNSFNLNESTIDMNESKLTEIVSTNSIIIIFHLYNH